MNFRPGHRKAITPTRVSAAVQVGAFNLPDFSHIEAQQRSGKLGAILLDLMENLDLYPTNYEFSPEWFDAAEPMFQSVLHARQIGHPRTGKPVKRETAESQKRIARAILDRVELAKAAIASATPFRILNHAAGKLIWIGSNGRNGHCGGETEHKQKRGSKAAATRHVDFAISIKGAFNCSGIRCIWDGPKLIYEMSPADDLKTVIGRGVKLGGGGTVTFYDGNENQLPPAAIEAFAGVGNTSAYRGQFLALFTNFPRVDGRDRISQLSFEFFTENSGDRSVANQYGTEILYLIRRFHSEPDLVRGKSTVRAAIEGGRAKGDSNQAERADWQREAERIWHKTPKLGMRSVACIIDKTKFETIRKVISRPKARP